MRNENIAHWVEPWQTASLSEMVPHGDRGRERNGVGLLASLICLVKGERERGGHKRCDH